MAFQINPKHPTQHPQFLTWLAQKHTPNLQTLLSKFCRGSAPSALGIERRLRGSRTRPRSSHPRQCAGGPQKSVEQTNKQTSKQASKQACMHACKQKQQQAQRCKQIKRAKQTDRLTDRTHEQRANKHNKQTITEQADKQTTQPQPSTNGNTTKPQKPNQG